MLLFGALNERTIGVIIIVEVWLNSFSRTTKFKWLKRIKIVHLNKYSVIL
ncbi:hypothetical protein FM109_12770 [Vibrio casei]|nr:hypothetical protein FM109_12770 [Vibrio casei]